MRIKEELLQYKTFYPFEASLCRVKTIYPHWHETAIEFIYCIKGRIHYIAAEQDSDIEAGHFRLIDRRDIHYIFSDSEDNLTLFVHLDLSRMERWEELKYVFFSCESDLCHPYQKEAIRKVRETILMMALLHFVCGHEAELPDSPAFFDICTEDFRKAMVMKNTNAFAEMILKYFNWFNYKNNESYMNQVLFSRFQNILAYCIENYTKKITVSELASSEHISRNYFSQFINTTVFNNFRTMVNYIRCYEAEYLLLQTDRSNAEIAYDCGFSDPQYFYAAFKKIRGHSPGEHRRQFADFCKKCQIENNRSETLDDVSSAVFIKDFISRSLVLETVHEDYSSLL